MASGRCTDGRAVASKPEIRGSNPVFDIFDFCLGTVLNGQKERKRGRE